MKLTNEQIEALRVIGNLAEYLTGRLKAGESVTVEREVKRWIPKPFFYDHSMGSIESAHCRKLVAYREEFAPGYVVPEIGDSAWWVFCIKGEWAVEYSNKHRIPGVVCMPRDVALDLANKLNSGEVVL